MASKLFAFNLFGEQEVDETAQATRRKLFIQRMERKLEFKKLLRNPSYRRHLIR